MKKDSMYIYVQTICKNIIIAIKKDSLYVQHFAKILLLHLNMSVDTIKRQTVWARIQTCKKIDFFKSIVIVNPHQTDVEWERQA